MAIILSVILLNLSEIFLKIDKLDESYSEKIFPTNETIKIIGADINEFIEFKRLFTNDLIKAKTIYLNLVGAQNTLLLYNFSRLYLDQYKKLKFERGYLDFDDQILALDNSMDAIRQRYSTQFLAMDKAIAGLNETEKALDNMMEAWKGSMK